MKVGGERQEILSPWEACGNLKIWYSKQDTEKVLILLSNCVTYLRV